MIATVSATEVGVFVTGVGVIVSLVVAVIALRSAKAAERQAEATARQADSAAKQADIAEREHERATQPRLQIARFPDGSAQVTNHREPARRGSPEDTVYIFFENVRDATAEITRALFGKDLGEIRQRVCAKGKNGIVLFAADPGWVPGVRVLLDVRYRARDGGWAGHLDGELEKTEGGWRIVRDADGQT